MAEGRNWQRSGAGDFGGPWLMACVQQTARYLFIRFGIICVC
jgi:hypothetical protein